MPLRTIAIILVEPQGSLNIGSTARAMMNFGLNDLRLVTPRADHLNDEARRMAVKATSLLEAAQIHNSLESALADCHYSIATTRRFGKYRERLLLPEEAADLLIPLSQTGRTALVFGREDHGLSTAEIDCCQRLLTIPSHEGLRSLNLAQSVAVSLYELFKSARKPDVSSTKGPKLATGQSLQELYVHMRQTLVAVGYLDKQNPDHILRAFRGIFGRAQLDHREVRILRGLLSRIDWLKKKANSPKGD